MAQLTSHYSFSLPEGTDAVSPTPFNNNWTALDTTLYNLQTAINGIDEAPWTILHQGTWTLPSELDHKAYNTYAQSSLGNDWRSCIQCGYYTIPLSEVAKNTMFDEMVFIFDQYNMSYRYYQISELTGYSTNSRSSYWKNNVPDFALSLERSFGASGNGVCPKRATIIARGGIDWYQHQSYLNGSTDVCSWNYSTQNFSTPNKTILRYSKREDHEIMLPYSDDQGVENSYILPGNSPYGANSTNRHTKQRMYYNPILGGNFIDNPYQYTYSSMLGPTRQRPIYNNFNTSDTNYQNSYSNNPGCNWPAPGYGAGSCMGTFTFDRPDMAFPLDYIPLFVFYRSMHIYSISCRVTLLGRNRSYSNTIALA